MRYGILTACLLAPLLGGWLTLDEPNAGPRHLRGIWDREGASDLKRVDFYYFHQGDLGLFRFGTTDRNHTEMFRFKKTWRGLEISFKRTGERAFSKMQLVERPDGRRALVLESDPRNGGRRTTYVHRAAPTSQLVPAAKDDFARMWMHRRPRLHGGLDFRIYQFQPANASGHGRGWYHEGDYDEWTTESLTYHKGQDTLHLRFDEPREIAASPYQLNRSRKAAVLGLDADPRWFGRPSRFEDTGPTLMDNEPDLRSWRSFTSALEAQ
ncbi:MAG: hypothetical protein HC923_03580 [Myxococcales bacterium]|nr:hypothetical protein [Myxococcales bacterium]